MTHALENELLLITACETLSDEGKKRLEHLLANQSVDWWHLLHLTIVHGTYPLLNKHLVDFSDSVPVKVLTKLRRAVDANTRKNFLFVAELIKLKSMLDKNGIEFITYKGPALALQAFGDLACREFTDLDIVIDRTQVPRVQNVLLAANYSPEPVERNLSNKFMHSSLFRRLTFEQTFSRRSNIDAVATSFVDIHWEVAPPYVISFDFDTLWKNSIELDILGRTLRTFSPEFLIVILCCHGTKHQWSLLRWIVDIAALIQRHPSLNWQAIYDIANQFGAAAKLDLALTLCNELPGFRRMIPSAVVSRLQSSQERFAKIRQQTLQSWFQPGVQKNNLRLYWHYELATFDTFGRRASFMLHELLQPDVPTYLRYPLPETLFGLYHVIHPLFTLSGFVSAQLRAAGITRYPFDLNRCSANADTASIVHASSS